MTIDLNTLTTFHIVFTLFIFVAFLTMIWRVFSRRNRKAFEEAALLPFADENPQTAQSVEDRPEVRQ